MNSKEKNNSSSLLGSESHTRKNGSATSAMRKYQQLALSIVTVISLVAFLFYKHEYDRLRYTLEYLEMFGPSPGDEGVSNALCASNVHRKLTTVPPIWVKISEDILVYSSFWDEGNGFSSPHIRTLAVIKKSEVSQEKLGVIAFYENLNSAQVSMECQVEKMKGRKHSNSLPSSQKDLVLAFIICKPENRKLEVPISLQFQIGSLPLSPPILIQESESWKSVANVTTACIYSQELTVTTPNIVEFIAFHNTIGIEKFVFFGTLLTPMARKLLDKYGDQIGIFYEEASFVTPKNFELNDEQKNLIIEKDCIYRHRDTHENVIVLKINQFLTPRSKSSIQGVLASIPSIDSKVATVSEFHFVTQRVCLDSDHVKKTDLKLDSQMRSVTSTHEGGVALVRPHLSTGAFSSKLSSASNEQHIPSSIATILNFEVCLGDDSSHADTDHLPSNSKFAEQVRKSLLYRKWKVNS